MFTKGSGNWTQYRGPDVMEVDFHWCPGDRHPDDRRGWTPYAERMGEVERRALAALRDAYERGVKRVLFTHGSSTSRPGATTARSVVRSVMRSTEATPYLCRRECIQHETVFVAAIRPKPPDDGQPPTPQEPTL
jgi:hypothetical protein